MRWRSRSTRIACHEHSSARGVSCGWLGVSCGGVAARHSAAVGRDLAAWLARPATGERMTISRTVGISNINDLAEADAHEPRIRTAILEMQAETERDFRRI